MSDDNSRLEDDIRIGDWILTNQPGDEPPSGPLPSARVPHLGHAVLFFAIAGLLLVAAQAVFLLPILKHGGSPVAVSLNHPKLLLAAEGVTYLLTLLAAWLLFPLLWHRSFAAGLNWNGPAAARLAPRLIPLGILSGWTVQAISSLIHMPKSVPMDDFFRSATDIWIVALFGTLLAPLFEEVCFRGFLLPAFTIASDWLGPWLRYLVRFSAARLRSDPLPEHIFALPEDRSAGLIEGTGNLAFRSRPALILASLSTSALFALLHAQQLGYTWPAVTLLACVSLLLTVVRIRTRSVACSTLVHASYNFSVFLLLFVATGGFRHLDRVAQ